MPHYPAFTPALRAPVLSKWFPRTSFEFESVYSLVAILRGTGNASHCQGWEPTVIRRCPRAQDSKADIIDAQCKGCVVVSLNLYTMKLHEV